MEVVRIANTIDPSVVRLVLPEIFEYSQNTSALRISGAGKTLRTGTGIVTEMGRMANAIVFSSVTHSSSGSL